MDSLGEVLEREVGGSHPELAQFRCSVGAHRGASVEHLENTLPALRAAERNPAFAFVEFDVQFTRDGQIVLFHDLTLLRVFGKVRSIGNESYTDLVELTEGTITTYAEAMTVVRRKKINIEIKSQGDLAEDQFLADEIIADLRSRKRLQDAMISSISADVVTYVKRTYPEVKTGQIFWLTSSTYLHLDVLTEKLYSRFLETDADYLMMHVANLRNVEDLLKLKPPDKTLIFWDFDDRMYLVHKDPGDHLWGVVSADADLRAMRRQQGRSGE